MCLEISKVSIWHRKFVLSLQVVDLGCTG